MEKRHTIIVFSSWLVPEMLLCPGLRWECNEWTVVPLGKKKKTPEKHRKEMGTTRDREPNCIFGDG